MWARDTSFAAIGMPIVFKAMRLGAVSREEYVEIEADRGLSHGGSNNKSLGKMEERDTS